MDDKKTARKGKAADLKQDPPQAPAASSEPIADKPPQVERFGDRKNNAPVGGSIVVKVNADGSPDFGSMRPATKEKLKIAILHPTAKAEFGIAEAKGIPAESIDPQVVGAFWGTVESVRAWFYVRKLQISDEIAARIAAYSPQEKEILVSLLTKVAAKYSSEFMAKWADEIALIGLFSMMEMTKYRQAKSEAEKQNPVPVELDQPKAA
jgi:hypothetical protein